MRFDEDKQLEIELAKLQIRHQHIASVFTVIISIVASLTVSIFIGYLSFGLTLNQSYWTYDALIVLGTGGTLLYITLHLYSIKIKELDDEIQKLKNKYLW